MACTATEISQTSQALERAVQQMKVAFTCLQDCYAADASRDPRFTEIRGNVTKSGLLYHDLHLPLTIKLVEDLKTAFKDYEGLSADDFVTVVGVVAEEINELSKDAELVMGLNKCLLKHLKLQKQDADKLVAQFNLDEEVSRRKAAEVTRWAESKKLLHDDKADAWDASAVAAAVIGAGAGLVAGGASLVAGTATAATAATGGAASPVAAPLAVMAAGLAAVAGMQASKHRDAGIAAKKDGARKALAHAEESKKSLAVATVINEKLLVALRDFTAAIKEVAEFTRILKSDIDGYAKNAKDAENAAGNNERLRVYKNTMAGFAKKIIKACNEYIAFEPNAKSEIHVILHLESRDHNRQEFIRDWLRAQNELNPDAYIRRLGL